MSLVHDVEGRLAALSHVFYFVGGNKCFFVDVISDDDVHYVIAVPLRRSHLLDLASNADVVGWRRIAFTRLKSRARDAGAPNSTRCLQVTSKTRYRFMDVNLSSLAMKSNVLLEGIVTDDRDSCSGLVVLNRKVHLMTTHLCHVTNIRKFQRGMTLIVANAHLVQNKTDCDLSEETTKPGQMLVCCARTTVMEKRRITRNEEQVVVNSLHDKSSNEAFGKDSVVLLTHKNFLSWRAVLRLIAFRRLMAKVDYSKDVAKIDCRGRNRLQECLTRLKIDSQITQVRSLAAEFHDHCDVKCVSSGINEGNELLDNVKFFGDIFSSWIQTLTDARKTRMEVHRSANKIVYDQAWHRETDSFVVGQLKLRNQQLYLCDGKQSFKLVLASNTGNEAQENFIGLDNSIVSFRDFTLVIDWFQYDKVQWNDQYIFVESNNLNCWNWNENAIKEEDSCDDSLHLDEVEGAPFDKALDVVAVLCERWMEQRRLYKGCSSTESFRHIPEDVVLQLKLRSRRSDSNQKSMSCYLAGLKTHPSGLLPGSVLRLSKVVKTVSQKGNLYLRSTLNTSITVLTAQQEQGQQAQRVLRQVTIREISGQRPELVSVSVSVELFVKVSLIAVCHYCEVPLVSGICDFQGCGARSGDKWKIRVRATLVVEDFSGPAHLLIQDSDQLQEVLDLSNDEWDVFTSLAHSQGELLYLHQSSTNSVFSSLLRLIPTVESVQIECQCRILKDQRQQDEQRGPRLYCVRLKRLK